jgi:hypothetical protein
MKEELQGIFVCEGCKFLPIDLNVLQLDFLKEDPWLNGKKIQLYEDLFTKSLIIIVVRI